MTMFPAELEAALSAEATQRALSRDDLLERIVRDWLATHDQRASAADTEPSASPPARPDKPDPEFVQYPGYFKGDGSL